MRTQNFPANTPPLYIGWYGVTDGFADIRMYWNGDYWQADDAEFGDSTSELVVEWYGSPTPLEDTVSAQVQTAVAEPIKAAEVLLDSFNKKRSW